MKGILVGFGNMAKVHLAIYKKLNIEIIGVVETDLSKQHIIKDADIKFVALTLSEISNLTEFDFIDICTPTYMHYQNLLDAMKFDKPIMIEKPLVRTQQEVDSLRKISFNKQVFVAEIEHYNPKLTEFLTYNQTPISIKMIREVNLEYFLKGSTPWFLDYQKSGGIVLDLMIHDIYLLVAKYGKPKIGKITHKQQKYSSIDYVTVDLEFDKFTANVTSSWISESKEIPIDVKMELKSQNDTLLIHNTNLLTVNDEEDPFYLEIKAFIKSIDVNKTPYAFDIYLDGVEVALEINERIKFIDNNLT
jgi:UDP-N-acetylglucosamine 3-dehydrogenase